MLGTVGFREHRQMHPLLAFIIAFPVLMSSFISHVLYHRGYSEEAIARERQANRWESLRRHLVDARAQPAGALDTLREASGAGAVAGRRARCRLAGDACEVSVRRASVAARSGAQTHSSFTTDC